MKQRVQYYSDLLNDDFSNTDISATTLPKTFRYVRTSIWWRIPAAFLYFIIAKPVLYILNKVRYRHRFANKKVIRQSRKEGAYIYANHTTKGADAFIPNILFPFKRNYIIVSPQAMSIPGIKILLQQLGIIPLSNKLSDKKKIIKTIDYRLKQKATITIFPEAHIWLFYNKIRPFTETSFKYPAMMKAPVYAMTNCFQKRKFRKFPKVVTYFDGPFYPKEEYSHQENAKYLRDLVYNAMVQRATEYSTYEYVQYIYKPKEKDTQSVPQNEAHQ